MPEANVPTPEAPNPTAPAGNAPMQPPKKNIFSKPGLSKQQQEEGVIRKKNKRNAYIRFGIAAVILIIYGAMFFFPQLGQYLNYPKQIASIQEEIETSQIALSQREITRDELKASYDQRFAEEQRIIDVILPETTDKLGVIRLLEDFAAFTQATYGDFEFNSIAFQPAVEEADYIALPFTTSIQASRENFDRFLRLVSLSGLIDSPEPIRLMEISQISLNYLGIDSVTGEDKGVNFNVTLKAYSRK